MVNITAQDIVIVIGAIYAVATAIGNISPNSIIGKFCLRVALILHDFQTITPALPQSTTTILSKKVE